MDTMLVVSATGQLLRQAIRFSAFKNDPMTLRLPYCVCLSQFKYWIDVPGNPGAPVWWPKGGDTSSLENYKLYFPMTMNTNKVSEMGAHRGP